MCRGTARARARAARVCVVGVGADQDPHRRVGLARQGRARVVERQDLVVGQTGRGGAVGTPLGHAAPVAVAVTDDRDRGPVAQRVALVAGLGQPGAGDHHAEGQGRARAPPARPALVRLSAQLTAHRLCVRDQAPRRTEPAGARRGAAQQRERPIGALDHQVERPSPSTSPPTRPGARSSDWRSGRVRGPSRRPGRCRRRAGAHRSTRRGPPHLAPLRHRWDPPPLCRSSHSYL